MLPSHRPPAPFIWALRRSRPTPRGSALPRKASNTRLPGAWEREACTYALLAFWEVHFCRKQGLFHAVAPAPQSPHAMLLGPGPCSRPSCLAPCPGPVHMQSQQRELHWEPCLGPRRRHPRGSRPPENGCEWNACAGHLCIACLRRSRHGHKPCVDLAFNALRLPHPLKLPRRTDRRVCRQRCHR